MIHARMTTTFECRLSQLEPDVVDQKYESLCDSSTQNMLYMLSTKYKRSKMAFAVTSTALTLAPLGPERQIFMFACPNFD